MGFLKFLVVVMAFWSWIWIWLAPTPANAQNSGRKVVYFGVGSVAGVYYPTGGAISRLMDKGRRAREHSIRCALESSEGSVENVLALGTGQFDVALVQSDVQAYAYDGTFGFQKTGPQKSLRSIFALQAEALTIVVRANSPIKSFDDLKDQRVSLGERGSGHRETMELLFKHYGWDEGLENANVYLNPRLASEALCAGKLEAYSFIIAHPNATVQETANLCPIRLIPLNTPQIQKFLAERPYYPTTTIPSGLYRGEPQSVPTFGPRATLLTTESLPVETAYQFAKTVYENLETLNNAHPALTSVKRGDLLLSLTAPLHPGAERYFREIGLIK
ncbi:MAG: TAXI family TRAP transporter solute-binding subunit [Deltaproteobacteria bacterium]|jgi:TRAP transporter TAXI family solute receptor|nr:TAXI family TRAP transporter solute-binding subunit [Deltaproteobacteria bacterium]